ncbi:MAG: trigger factor [Dysgonamonadaceae bacterium]|jgi:trigger factor|nr:trigger factor [Dysgonamonadaceae bacterium]
MKCSFNRVDEVNATVTIEVTAEDYLPKVEKIIGDMRKSVVVPGFRKGAAPASMIKKTFWKPTVCEEINKMVTDRLGECIMEEKLNILGEPMQDADKVMVEPDEKKSYTFVFYIGMAPELIINIGKEDRLPYYRIQVSDEMIDRHVENLLENGGEYTLQETVSEKDIVKGVLTELDADGEPKQDGTVIQNAAMMPSFFVNEEEKEKIIGAAVNSTVIFNPFAAYAGSGAELSSLLKIKKDEVTNHAGDFSYEISEISNYKEAEINQDLFDKSFGKDAVKNEAEFRAMIADQISEQLAEQSDYMFMADMRKLLKLKVSSAPFPEAFLKRWLAYSYSHTEEKVAADYPALIEGLKTRLINERLMEDLGISVDDGDILEEAKESVCGQIGRFGMASISDELLEHYAKEVLKHEGTIQALTDKVISRRITDILKERLTVEEQTVSAEEFQKIFNQKS